MAAGGAGPLSILAIDPGPTESALLLYDEGVPQRFEKCPNEMALAKLEAWGAHVLAVEFVASYGMAVGAEVFETVYWSGRFIEHWTLLPRLLPGERVGLSGPRGAWRKQRPWERVYRREVKMLLCGSMRAKDANVRQAIIDRFGGRDMALGKKASPGPLYGLSGDCWAALGVAITAAER